MNDQIKIKEGCWDHACPYRTDPKPRVGTNGGCRCDACPRCGCLSKIARHYHWCPDKPAGAFGE